VTLPATPVVEVRALTKRYRRRVAVDGIELSIQPGELYGLIGPDGAGKSSLMKAIAGVLTFDAGEVVVFGISLTSERAAESVKDRIGFMPQGLGLNLYPELSVEENVDFFARLRLLGDAERSERKERLLALTRLTQFRSRAMKHLSGGMKQKLGLICTLVHEPKLLILDEPTTGVDPVSRRDFWNILGELMRDRGISALVSTAYLDEASRFDRVSLMYASRVIAQGEPEEITSRAPGTVVSLPGQEQMRLLHRLKGSLPQAQAIGSTLRVFVAEPDAASAVRMVSAAVPDADPETFVTSTPELEDAFVALVQTTRAVDWAVMPLEASRQPSVPAASDPAVEAIELTRAFDSFVAAEDVSFVVPQGTIFGLLGANGAGKTTVIKMLTGILAPTRGTGRVAGVDMRAAPRSIKEHIGYMSQSFSLYTELTVVENIRLYAGVYGLDRQETGTRLQWVLGLTGLNGHQHERAERLPMGLRQRLALGCALVHRPRVLFLDEPTAGVDAVGRRQLWDILVHLSRELGVAILVTTHYMSEAEHCDQLALMYAGRIVADGSPAKMKRDTEAEIGQVLEVSADDPRRAAGALRRGGFPDATIFGRHVHLFSKAPDEDAVRVQAVLAAAGLRFEHAVRRPVSMEDVFVSRVTKLEAGARSAGRTPGGRAAAGQETSP
jgi:ABC-type multidrug transport system ATPase subunit